MKKIITPILIILVIAIVSFFLYAYYIKPQREFIKIDTIECINKAMAPISDEVSKQYQTTYKTKQWFDSEMIKQENNINNCITKYNSILFSGPERSLLILNTNSSIDNQNKKIESYLKILDGKIKDSNEQKAKKQACSDMTAMKEKYQNCINDEMKKNPGSSEVLDFILFPEKNQSKNVCLQKYNYIKFGVDEMDCAMMGIFGY